MSTFSFIEATEWHCAGCDRPLVVTSRTYNTAATGTFGQYIELKSSDQKNSYVPFLANVP